MLPYSVLCCTQCSSAKAPVHTCFPIYSSPGFATRATCKLVELTSWQAETKGHSASHGTMHTTNQSETPPVFLQTFLAQPKPVSEAPLHGCFQSRSARVHFPSKQLGSDTSQELPSKLQPTKVKHSHFPSFSFIYNVSLLTSMQTSRSSSIGSHKGSASL